MSTRVDRRFLDRRRHVQEDEARRQLRWGITLVISATLTALLILAFCSPLLAVRDVVVSGSSRANIDDVLKAHGVAEGVPTIAVRTSRIEDAIEADPWVARASVRVTWPGSIELTVLEHVPAAWMKLDLGWVVVSATGGAPRSGQPGGGSATGSGRRLPGRLRVASR